jgi:hypothetical protein
VRKWRIAVLVSAEYYEMQPPENAFIPPNVPGGFPPPTVPTYFFQLADALPVDVGPASAPVVALPAASDAMT